MELHNQLQERLSDLSVELSRTNVNIDNERKARQELNNKVDNRLSFVKDELAQLQKDNSYLQKQINVLTICNVIVILSFVGWLIANG